MGSSPHATPCQHSWRGVSPYGARVSAICDTVTPTPNLPSNSPKLHRKMKESDVQQEYYKRLGGEKEYQTKHGRIDLKVGGTLYEFKKFRKYKDVLGQLLAYRECVRCDRLVAVLFNTPYHRFDLGECRMVEEFLGKYGVEVEFISKY